MSSKSTAHPAGHGTPTYGLAFAMLGGFVSQPAFAYDADQTAEKDATKEVVVVTGSTEAESPKFTAPLRDTPRSITVIPDEILDMTASTTLAEALRTVPGITFGAGEGGNPLGDRPFLRGADSQSSTFIDGVRDIGAQSREAFNIESIEVIKGASGAYAGRGGPGGGIYINNKVPTLTSAIKGSVGVGTDDYVRGTIDVNQKIGDSSGVRLNAMYHDSGVAGRDEIFTERWGVAPSFAMGLGSPTRAYISYYHLESEGLPDTGVPYNNPLERPRTDTPRVLPVGDGGPVNVDREAFYGLVNRDFRDERADLATVRIEHDFSSDLHVRNTTRYGESMQDYIYTQPDDSQGNIYYGYVWRRANTRVSNVRSLINQTDVYGTFDTGPVAHSFAAGLEVSREEGENDSYVVTSGGQALSAYNRCLPAAVSSFNCASLFNPNPNDAWTGSIVRSQNPNNSVTETKAAYLFDTIKFTPQWQLNVGVRFDSYSAEYTSARATATPFARTTFKRKDDLVNYQASLIYKPVEAATIYGSVATSSAPAGNALNQGSDPNGLTSTVNANLEPEENDLYEIGGKWDLFGGDLSLSGAVFHTETANSRITLADGTVAMAGEKEVDGVEIGVTGQITPEWMVFGGYTYLDAVLVRAGGSGAAFGLNDGLQFPNTPKHSASLTTSYQILPQLNVGMGAYYMDKVYGNASTATINSTKYIPSYTRLDLMATYVFTDDLRLQLNVQNLTDEYYFNQAYPTHYVSVAPGRSATLTLNYGF
jgi:catecholate siderophore receptor